MKEKAISILYIGNMLSVHGSTPTSIETLGPRLEQEGFRLYYASSKQATFFRLTDMLLNIGRYSRKIDLVLIDTYSTKAFYFAWASSLVCRMLGLRYIPMLRGGDLPRRIAGSPALTRQIFENSFTNVVISGYLQQCLEERGFNNLLIPNNIDLESYLFRCRSEIKPKLLWVRAFHKTYNPAMAIQVLALLLKHYPEASLTMVGPEKDGSMRECKALAQKLQIESRISFTGRLSKEDWISLAAHHDVFINTTDFDNLPVSVMEAMALGLPVVSTNVGGVPFLIDNNKDGVLIEPGNAAGMANAIEALLRDRKKTAAISKAAREKAENYDWLVIRQKWHELFSSLPN